MKSITIRSFAVSAALFMTLPAFAKTVVARCENSDHTKLVLVQNGETYDASVSMESTGDSYPTFHYKNLTLLPPIPRQMGAPEVYKGKAITIEINHTVLHEPATLNIPELGIDNEVLDCD